MSVQVKVKDGVPSLTQLEREEEISPGSFVFCLI